MNKRENRYVSHLRRAIEERLRRRVPPEAGEEALIREGEAIPPTASRLPRWQAALDAFGASAFWPDYLGAFDASELWPGYLGAEL